jgi:hypothetical protein
LSQDSSCPSESAFAALAAGQLASAARAALEQHIDRCASCSDLVGLLGTLADDDRVDGTLAASSGPVHAGQPSSGRCEDVAVMLTSLATQLCFSIFVWLPAARCLIEHHTWDRGWPTGLLLIHLTVTGALGQLASLGHALATSRRSQWAQRLLALHAWLNIPTVLMTPIAMVELCFIRWRRQPLDTRPARSTALDQHESST